jgi:hypothetical protein
MACRRETARGFGRRRTTATPAEIEKRAHPSSRAPKPRRHRCASALRSSRIRSRGFFPAGKPPKALCPSPRSSRARMRSRAARSLRSVTQRSNSSSRTSMSPKKHKPCRAEEPHGTRENRSSMHFPPSKPPEVRQGFQWSVKPRTRTRPVGHWRARLAVSHDYPTPCPPFRRQIGRLDALLLMRRLGQAEIEDLETAVSGDEEVLGRDVRGG